MKENTLTRHLRPLLESARITALDVGARGGFTEDLLPIASAVDAIGFEPDPEECRRLNEQDHGPWRSLRFVPAALGRTGTRNLNIYRKRGCSSFLEADVELAKSFGRDHYYSLEGQIEVNTLGLDEAAKRYGFEEVDFLKIDIQGAEMEVFETGGSILEGVLALRSEVSFLPIYRGQSLVEDILRKLRRHDLVPLGFPELHHWRRSTLVKPHRLSPGPYPYSEGQIIHGDILFIREFGAPSVSEEGNGAQMIKTAVIAIAYGYIDHAVFLLTRPGVKPILDDLGLTDIGNLLSRVSKSSAKRKWGFWSRIRQRTKR